MGMEEKAPESSVIPEKTIIRVLHYSIPQLQFLNKDANIFIDSPPEYTKSYLKKLAKVCGRDSTKALANLLANSSRHMTTFIELICEMPPGEVRTVQVETHIFVFFSRDFNWNEDTEIM